MDDAGPPSETDQDSGSHETSARKRLKQLGKEILKRGLPDRLLSEIREYRKNPRNERATYLRLRVLRGPGFRAMGRLRVPSTCRSFLFVCFGNIMRSPMCEALAKRALAELPSTGISIASAGLHAKSGREAHPLAISAASEIGIDLSHHRARLMSAEMVAQADAILAMDCRNVVELLTRFPAAKNKIYMLGAYAGNSRKSVEIEDPYYGDEQATRHCYQTLQTCIDSLISSLVGSRGKLSG
jgi:protein-tyrosine phosphatase